MLDNNHFFTRQCSFQRYTLAAFGNDCHSFDIRFNINPIMSIIH